MDHEILLEFWSSYKSLDEAIKVRNSSYLKKEHTEYGEKMVLDYLIDLRDNATKLIEDMTKK